MIRILLKYFFILTCIFYAGPAFAATRLGLHVTQEELDIWKQRVASGPYRSTGDVSTNSPGDWNRIVSNASQNLSSQRWAGYTGIGCVPNGASLGNVLPLGDYIRDAAFNYLVTGDLTKRNNVIAELVAQAGVPGTNFSNSSKWCVIATNSDNFFRPALWVTKYIYAWDYILAGDQVYGQAISPSNRAVVEAWLLGAASYFDAITNKTLSLYYVDRKNNNYAFTSEGVNRCTSSYYGSPWYGAPNVTDDVANFDNRSVAIALPSALVAVQQNHANLKADAIRYFKDVITYGTWADNTINSMKRRRDTNPGLGLVYSFTGTGILIQMADAFARNGDTGLYDFSTSNGACGSAGGPKSLRGIMTNLSQYVDHTFLRYGTSFSTSNANYLIDTNDEIANNNIVLDHVLAQGNLYHKDNYVKSVYMRTMLGKNGYIVPGYPTSPSTGGYYAWGNSWGIQSGVLFMFGQMEGKVWPYGGAVQSLLGDLNGDRIVNSLDWSLMSAKWLTNDTNADLNKDGAVNSLDWSIMSSNWLASL